MSVIPITVFLSLGLVFIFVALFWREQRRNRFASAERDSLLPLADESPRLVAPGATPLDGRGPDPAPARPHGDVAAAGHRPGDDSCGCERGEHPPCAGCLRAAAPVAPVL